MLRIRLRTQCCYSGVGKMSREKESCATVFAAHSDIIWDVQCHPSEPALFMSCSQVSQISVCECVCGRVRVACVCVCERERERVCVHACLSVLHMCMCVGVFSCNCVCHVGKKNYMYKWIKKIKTFSFIKKKYDLVFEAVLLK